MKNRSINLTAMSCAAAGVLLASQSLFAGMIMTQDSYGNDSLGGGEFRVVKFTQNNTGPLVNAPLPTMDARVPDARNTATRFQTFCVEYTEHITHNTDFYWDMNTGAVAGGAAGGGQNLALYHGGHGTGDELDPKTAYLYTKFWNGTLSNYDYSPNNGPNAARETDGYDLQRVIWYIEQETNGDVSSGQRKAWYDEAVAAVASGAWSGIGNVRVLNLYTNEGLTGKAQDQLTMMVPTPTAAVGGLGLLAGFGVLKMVSRRRERGREMDHDEPQYGGGVS